MKVKKKKLKAYLAECVKEMSEKSYICSRGAFIGKISGYPVRIEVLTANEAWTECEHDVNNKLPKKLNIISD